MPYMSEKLFFTVQEIAERWVCSEDKVTRVFRYRPGVLNLGSHADKKKRKRAYSILRVPAAVLVQVEAELTV